MFKVFRANSRRIVRSSECVFIETIGDPPLMEEMIMLIDIPSGTRT